MSGPSRPSCHITSDQLGCAVFKQRHRIKYAYVSGSMYKGIASKELVVRMGQAGLLAYLGTGGMKLDRMEADLRYIQERLAGKQSYGANLLASPLKPELETATVDLLLRCNVSRIEAAAYMQMSPDLVRYRVSGLRRNDDGSIFCPHLVLGKVSRPEVAQQFLSPAPAGIVNRLLEAGRITRSEAELSQQVPVVDDLCVEADSGGHTDQGVAYALVPSILRQRDEVARKYRYPAKICVGASGGLGTPEAIAASFVLGADFVLTGSINQCTVEGGTSDRVKDLLEQAEVQDTAIVPAGDMFELGATVQVFSRGRLFPARARKLYDLYRQHNSLEEIDEKTRQMIQSRYFKRSFAEVYAETKVFYEKHAPEMIERAERDPKQKMALIFRWYFVQTNRLALKGDPAGHVDYQIHCGPALGAFNRFVKGTRFESWRQRHVDEIAELLMSGAARCLEERFRQYAGPAEDSTAAAEALPVDREVPGHLWRA